MRREIVIFAVILALVLGVGLFGRSLITGVAVKGIKDAFPGYDVSIAGTEVRGADMVAITGISIKKDKTFSCTIKGLEVKFSPLSLFTKKVMTVTIKNTSLEIVSRDKKLKDIIGSRAPGSGKGFSAKFVVMSNLNLKLDTADLLLITGAEGNMETFKAPAGEIEIKGDFSIVPGAGKVAIRDEALLKRIAAGAKQPPAAVEYLKDLDFTSGNLQISGNPESPLLHITLEGPKGRIDLTFPLRGL